jgi:hypothetical protein
MGSTWGNGRRPRILRRRSSGRPRSGDASSNTSAATEPSSRTRRGYAWFARCASSSNPVPASRRLPMPSSARCFRCVENTRVESSSTMGGEPGPPTSTPRSSRRDCWMPTLSICFRSKRSLRSSNGPRHPRLRRTGRRSGRSAKRERKDAHRTATVRPRAHDQGRWAGMGSCTGGSVAGSGMGSEDGTGSVSGRTSNSRFGFPMFIASLEARCLHTPHLIWSRAVRASA